METDLLAVAYPDTGQVTHLDVHGSEPIIPTAKHRV